MSLIICFLFFLKMNETIISPQISPIAFGQNLCWISNLDAVAAGDWWQPFYFLSHIYHTTAEFNDLSWMMALNLCFLFSEFASRYRVTEREDQDHFGTVRHSRCAVRQTFKKEEIKTSSQPSKVFSATVRGENHRRTLALFVASILRVAVLSWTVHPP